jgi:hypothetical protein
MKACCRLCSRVSAIRGLRTPQRHASHSEAATAFRSGKEGTR